MEQKLKSAITRQKILNAAEEIFAAKGPDAARVDEIAALAGVNKQRIYAHFGCKEMLYETVLEEVYRRRGAYEEPLSGREFKGPETVRAIVFDYFDFLMKNPNFVRLMLWENLNYAQAPTAFHRSPFPGVEGLLCDAMEKGKIRRNLDIDQTVVSINMFCFSAFSNVHTLSRLLSRDLVCEIELRKRAAHIADVLIRYICG